MTSQNRGNCLSLAITEVSERKRKSRVTCADTPLQIYNEINDLNNLGGTAWNTSAKNADSHLDDFHP